MSSILFTPYLRVTRCKPLSHVISTLPEFSIREQFCRHRGHFVTSDSAREQAKQIRCFLKLGR